MAQKSPVLLKSLFPFDDVKDFAGVEVRRLCLDSRQIEVGDCFVAMPGERVDGRQFISAAIDRGATTVICEALGGEFTVAANDGAVQIDVPDLRGRLSAIAGCFYGHPSRDLLLVGITGTNGKTTCSQWLAEVLMHLGQRSASVGTLGYGVSGEELTYTGMTTPDAIRMQEVLSELVDQNVSAVVTEVSSHSLVLGRVTDLNFNVAVMTNISRDHLDFHGDEASYIAAKCELMKFADMRGVVLNKDDACFAQFSESASAPVVSVALRDATADFYCSDVSLDSKGIKAELHTPAGKFSLTLPIWGEFNLHNVVTVIAAAHVCGHEISAVVSALDVLGAVDGRLEPVKHSSDISVLVDFAHTPDALEAVLKALKQHTADTQSVFCVFGCGGDRDKGKRAQMAAIAEKHADHVVVTSDNPRSEAPADIIEDIKQGFVSIDAIDVIEDRDQAIAHAIVQSHPGDIVLLAGKGHENYQQVGDKKLPFSDFESALKALEIRAGGARD